jgi:hypothetical protein
MSISNKSIIPECYIDSCLVEVLIKAGKDIVNHQKSNGKVANEMKLKFNNDFCIGIIDEDKEQLDYLNEFSEVRVTEDLKLWQRRDKLQYIIQIRPVVEKWILKNCAACNIDIWTDYKLPADVKELIKITKSTASRTDERFVRLFKDMLSRQCKAVMDLKNWIEYLKEKNYQADINELINV